MHHPVNLFFFVVALQKWVATASDFLDPCALPAGDSLTEVSDHSIFGEVLSAYVSVGTVGPINSHLVDYDSLRSEPARLLAYLRQLCDVSEAQLRTWQPSNALALLINAYNALLLSMVVHYNPNPSVRDIATPEGSVWKHKFLNLGGVKVSADEIEHDMIRGMNGGFGYARKIGGFVQGLIHAGVVCASLACPDLQLVPFKGSTVVAQLGNATEAWLANPTKNPGLQGGGLKVSKIFSWYAGDFVFAEGSVHDYLKKYAPASWGSITSSMPLSYLRYDWYLNKKDGIASLAARWLSIGLALSCSLIPALSCHPDS